jgi:hypothetical protein
MKSLTEKLIAAITGILLGAASYHLFYGWYDIFPWAIAALIIGFISKNRRSSIINGAIFGYLLFLVYILMGYRGKTDVKDLGVFIGFNLLFSLVGAIAGVVGSFIGNWVKRFLLGTKNNER